MSKIYSQASHVEVRKWKERENTVCMGPGYLGA